MEARVENLKSESELWIAFKEDSKEAFAIIYHTYVRMLYNYGMKIIPEEAFIEDAIQELFIELWNHRKSLSHPVELRFYLIRAFKWKLNRMRKKESKRIRKPESKNPKHVETSPPYENFLIDQQILEERKTKLIQAVENLPERQREIIHLFFFENFNYEQIAEIMSINVRSAYTLSWKALSTLKKLVTK